MKKRGNGMILKNKKPDKNKLIAFGFSKQGSDYVYRTELLGGQFEMTVNVASDGEITTELTDTVSGDEYVLHLVGEAVGSFVGQVREAYDSVLSAICRDCFESDIYKAGQTNEIIQYIKDKYEVEPEFPWDDENSVIRRKDNNKWYAVFLKVPARRIGIECDDVIEILNIKMKPDTVLELTDGKRYFPAYHMNKKHWITVLLGGGVDTEEILRHIDESYRLAHKKG